MRNNVDPAGHEVSLSFPTTQWSLVARAGRIAGGTDEERRKALAELFVRYRTALRAHLLWRRVPVDQVDDLLQQFVADRMIEHDLLSRADRARGGFRSFLITSLDNFVSNQFRHDHALCRRPSCGEPISLDTTCGTPLDGTPLGSQLAYGSAKADPFDVAWARESLAEALRRMKAGCIADGRADLWVVFNARILQPALANAEPVPYGTLVRQCGYSSWKQAANALVTAKRRFEQALREVLAEHINDLAELEQELAALATVLASAAHL